MRFGKRKQTVLDYLGKPYTIKTIDREDCVYRSLGNGYDIEISGIDRPEKRKNICDFIAVWEGLHTVKYVRDIESLEQLKAELDKIVEEYGKKVYGVYAEK